MRFLASRSWHGTWNRGELPDVEVRRRCAQRASQRRSRKSCWRTKSRSFRATWAGPLRPIGRKGRLEVLGA